MKIDKHAEFWQEKDKWFLEPTSDPDRYLIVGHNNRGKNVSVVIEDDDTYKAVVQRMIEEGVKILTSKEAKKLHSSTPEDFDPGEALDLLDRSISTQDDE